MRSSKENLEILNQLKLPWYPCECGCGGFHLRLGSLRFFLTQPPASPHLWHVTGVTNYLETLEQVEYQVLEMIRDTFLELNEVVTSMDGEFQCPDPEFPPKPSVESEEIPVRVKPKPRKRRVERKPSPSFSKSGTALRFNALLQGDE